ncbi:S9 family peptidase [Candidatus Trichorickettsia mobilis]|uniref:S9 family peptidase n=1 Tax=Candidatus Trichorickettsia mobilis TaxID=1346319 RepID=UPI00292FA201|nr:S9 family peptidase [Candidatus Trichorickettsia mobilis]
MIPPQTEKIAHSLTIHNQTINDEYEWLRDKNWPIVKDPKILQHLINENNYFEQFFADSKSQKEQIFEELKARIKLDDQSPYIKRDNYYYYTRTEADKEYPIHCRKMNNTEAAEEILLDVNKLAASKKFTKISALSISPDHKLMAYAADFSGDERYTIYVYDLINKEYLADEINNTLGDIVWHEHMPGFFYTPTNENWRCDTVMFHMLGDKQADKVILHEPNSLYNVNVAKSASRQYIIINVGGHDSNETYVFGMSEQNFIPVLVKARQDGIFYDLEHHGNYFYIKTNEQAKKFRIARVAIDDFANNNWENYITEEQEQYLTNFDITQNYLILNYTVLGLSLIKILDLNTLQLKIIHFPDQAYAANAGSTNFDEDDLRVTYSSLARPNTTYKYDFLQDSLSILKVQEIPSGFNPDEYTVERIFVDTDNVKVPITLFYKKSLFKKDGSNPLYLYGYGSYGYGIPLVFRNAAVSMVNRGFVFAIAHIRGGDELGHEWYEAAKFLNKTRTFNDFIASAKKLIAEKYTSIGNIVICGGSAGGLLIGTVLNQAPELFKAAIAHVPFVDVLNTMLDESLPLTPGEFKEWGNPKELEYFNYIKSYSPYDNVSAQNYPTIMVTAGLSDPRVGYWEAAKWVARLRATKTDDNLIVLKTNMEAGHAGASGRFDYLKETADDLVFMFKVFKKN